MTSSINLCDEPFLDNSTLSKVSGATGVHYISLKPFSKKERRRQKAALAAEGVADMGAAPAAAEEEEDDEEYQPRSPVPLPDAATCKPILVQLGFSALSSAEKPKKKKGESGSGSTGKIFVILFKRH